MPKSSTSKSPKKTLQKNSSDDQREKALDMALAGIEKAFGKGAIMKLGARSMTDVAVISTGCLDLDLALGVGGVPRGRIIEIYGPEASGKTTLTLHIIAEAQKQENGTAAFIDAEHALDPGYAKNLGVNIDELFISQPDTGEQALEICEALVRSGAIDLVVIDSVAALVPRAEIDGDMGDSFMGLQARLMSQALRKLAGIVHKTNCTVIFINQLREKIGSSYGPSETTTGGKALKFYASVRLDVRRAEQLKSGTSVVGNKTKIKVVKNKLAPPFRAIECDIIYGEGISREGSLLDRAVEQDIIHKSGTWFSYGDQRIGQGRDNVRKYLKEHPELYDEIDKLVREKLSGNFAGTAVAEDTGEDAEDEMMAEMEAEE